MVGQEGPKWTQTAKELHKAKLRKVMLGSVCSILGFNVLTPGKIAFSLIVNDTVRIILVDSPRMIELRRVRSFEVEQLVKMFIKSYDILFTIQQGECKMRKTCITRKQSDTISTVLKEEDNLGTTGILISLKDLTLETRKKEAAKPLYLIRYE